MTFTPPRLSDYFKIDRKAEKTHNWVLASHDADRSPEEALAEALAIRIMYHRVTRMSTTFCCLGRTL